MGWVPGESQRGTETPHPPTDVSLNTQPVARAQAHLFHVDFDFMRRKEDELVTNAEKVPSLLVDRRLIDLFVRVPMIEGVLVRAADTAGLRFQFRCESGGGVKGQMNTSPRGRTGGKGVGNNCWEIVVFTKTKPRRLHMSKSGGCKTR